MASSAATSFEPAWVRSCSTLSSSRGSRRTSSVRPRSTAPPCVRLRLRATSTPPPTAAATAPAPSTAVRAPPPSEAPWAVLPPPVVPAGRAPAGSYSAPLAPVPSSVPSAASSSPCTAAMPTASHSAEPGSVPILDSCGPT